MAILIAARLALFAQNATDVGHLIASDLKAGKYEEARELLDSALKKSPRDARLWTLNGLALVRLGKQNEALASYDRALQISPDYVPALESAAELEFEAGNPGAADLVRRLLKIRPGDKTSHAMLAQIAFNQGECEVAKDEFAQTQPANAPETAALEEFGACLVKQKRTIEAIPVFRRVSELHPGSEHALYSLAVVQFLAGQYSDVVATLTPVASSRQPGPDALEVLAEAFEFTLDTPRAMEALKQAIAAQPSASRYYVDFANICLAHGLFQAGIDMLNSGLKRIPDSAPLYVERGILYSELAQYERGEQDFKTAERLDPSVELGSAAQGLAELQRNDLGQAETTARKRLRQQPSDAFVHYLLAEILTRKGAAPGSPEFDEAVKAASTAVELQPNLALARDVLGRLYLEQGKTDEAIEQSRLALRANAMDETALYHLIQALRKADKTDELPALLKQLVALREQARKQTALERNLAFIEKAPGSQHATSNK